MENAIIMASGMGTRMLPLTKTTPKPLIKVMGTPMIETVINGLERRGVDRIYVVVGYLGEQFGYLTEKYPNITIIRNPDYETVNNISSVYYAADVLRSGACFICEADLYAADEELFRAALTHSCYYGKMVEGYSADWVFEQDCGRITRVGKGGTDCYNMVGVSYFTAKDAAILADCITSAYGSDGYEEKFWDDVVNENLHKLDLTIHPIRGDQIVEIDTVEELEEVNKKYGASK